MISPESHFKDYELYDAEKLRQHCEHNFVRYITSERFPGLVMLHYADECAYDKKWNIFSPNINRNKDVNLVILMSY